MAAAATAQGVRPQVPAPDTYDGKPASLRGWLFSVELYFKACRLDFLGTDQDYCGALALSLLRGMHCCGCVGTLTKGMLQVSPSMQMSERNCWAILKW